MARDYDSACSNPSCSFVVIRAGKVTATFQCTSSCSECKPRTEISEGVYDSEQIYDALPDALEGIPIRACTRDQMALVKNKLPADPTQTCICVIRIICYFLCGP
jgi:hypothetical protein